MQPKLKPASTLDEIYHFFNGDIGRFLQSKHVNNETLIAQVRQELKQKASNEISNKIENAELWRQWFSQKQMMIAEKEAQAERNYYARTQENQEKQKRDSAILGLKAHQKLLIGQAKSPINAKSGASGNRSLSTENLFITDIEILVEKGVVSKAYLDDLKNRVKSEDQVIQLNALKDLYVLTHADIKNENKTAYSKISNDLNKEDKESLYLYLDYEQHDRNIKNNNLHLFFSRFGVDSRKLNAEQQKVLGFREFIANLFEEDNKATVSNNKTTK